jgi:hypothetical protein
VALNVGFVRSGLSSFQPTREPAADVSPDARSDARRESRQSGPEHTVPSDPRARVAAPD